jgi:Mrp family chromosome partitioning ATPase
MIYKSFAEFAKSQAINIMAVTDADTVMRAAAIVVAGEIKRRIENEGKNSAGTQMKTKSKTSFGAYSEAYGKKRARKGRQTGIIDLNFTGKMFRTWLPVPTERGWGATFVDADQLKIAGYNEERFGGVFGPTAKENKIGLTEINRQFKAIMKRKSA